MDPARDLSRHVKPKLSEARLARQWGRIDALSGSIRARRWPLAAALGAAVLAVLLFAWKVQPWRGHQPVAIDGAIFESGDASGQRVTLADGSHIDLGPKTRLSVVTLHSDDVRLALERGDVTLEVTHVPGRSFVVSARGVDVRVVGTLFRVAIEGEPPNARVAVSVERGRVQVVRDRREDQARMLSEGESWSTVDQPVEAARTAAELEGDAGTEIEIDEDSPTATPGSSPPPRPHPSPDTYRALGSNGFTKVLSMAGPRELFEWADAARLAGQPRDAAKALDALRRRYPKDGRAGLAAFQLGRLCLDTLSDPKCALDALTDAIALGPNTPFREDAEARRVEALDALGASKRCADARDAYLSRYPRGAHAATVATRCSGK